MRYWLPLIVLLLDQLLKALVFLFVEPGGLITLTVNNGVTFGFLQGGAANGVMIAVSVVATTLIFMYMRRARPREAIALSMIMGGVLGNLVDRVFRQGVVDYINLGFFPVFNLADICITGGIALLILYELPFGKNLFQKRSNSSSSSR